ncbi:MAG: M23 family metallopeptidase [Akkermansiaceae bacterium]|jgi:murein DD-endopeptidase MepM/ murein hydrolase activator NlpD|nr:M23 family metallopeptidase [Akkermansiaceae bacterium]
MSARSIRWFHPLTVGLILVGGAMILAFYLGIGGRKLPAVENLATFQTADAPLFLPADGTPRHRVTLASAWDLARIPTAVRFDSPMGAANGALTYNAQKFREPNDKRGGPHLGDDLNGIGGMNTDLGDPVHAVADGVVLYAAEPSAGWGNIVVLAHRLTDERVLTSMYAHLDGIDVAVGTLVQRGARIGSVGTANGYYPAHLHFEIREGDAPDIGPGYGEAVLNRLDPSATLASLRGAPDDAPAPAMLSEALSRSQPWNLLELSPEDAARLGEILDTGKDDGAEER